MVESAMSVLLSVMVSVSASAAPTKAESVVCDIQKLKASSVTVFQSPKNKSKWIALNGESRILFGAVGFEELKGSLPKLSAAANVQSCSSEKKFHKVFSSPNNSVALIASNHCEEKIAESLGLSASVPRNFGSMEAGHVIPWASIKVCTDGSKIYSCPDPTPEMAKCLGKL